MNKNFSLARYPDWSKMFGLFSKATKTCEYWVAFKDHFSRYLVFNCVIHTQQKVKLQLAIARKCRQIPCVALSYLPREFLPVMVRSVFIKLECQKSKKDKSHVIKKYPELLPVSDLNILVLTDTNWRRKPQIQWESKTAFVKSSVSCCSPSFHWIYVCHPSCVQKCYLLSFWQISRAQQRKCLNRWRKKYICSSVGGIFAHW